VSHADQRRYDELRRKLRKERGSIAAPPGGDLLSKKEKKERSNSEGGTVLDPGDGEEIEISGGAREGVSGSKDREGGSFKKRKA